MERVRAVKETFAKSLADLGELKRKCENIRDLHYFRLLAHAVMKHSGYTYANDDLDTSDILDDASDLWYRGSNKFIALYSESPTSCLFLLWDVTNIRIKCMQFFTYALSNVRSEAREDGLRNELSTFVTDLEDYWLPVLQSTQFQKLSLPSTSNLAR